MAPIRAVCGLFACLLGVAACVVQSAQDPADRLIEQMRDLPRIQPGGRMTAEEEHRRRVYGDVRALGTAGIPAMVRGLRNPDVRIRRSVVLILGALAGHWYELSEPRLDIHGALPALVEALRDSDSSVRAWSAQAIGALGPDAVIAVPGLVALLERPNEEARIAAAIALRDIGPVAKPALPALRRAMADSDGDVRGFAMRALEAIELSPVDASTGLPVPFPPPVRPPDFAFRFQFGTCTQQELDTFRQVRPRTAEGERLQALFSQIVRSIITLPAYIRLPRSTSVVSWSTKVTSVAVADDAPFDKSGCNVSR